MISTSEGHPWELEETQISANLQYSTVNTVCSRLPRGLARDFYAWSIYHFIPCFSQFYAPSVDHQEVTYEVQALLKQVAPAHYLPWNTVLNMEHRI